MSQPTPFVLTTPLPPADLRFLALSHASGLGVLEETRLDLLSDKPDIEAEKLLGRPVDLAVLLRDGARRHFCGLVTRFSTGRHLGRWYGYRATVRPWLWFLTRTADCRIFQELTVPEIVAKVFEDHAAVAVWETRLERRYRRRGYCVQYRETDFNFVCRLLEDEGIAWFFEHAEGEHKLVLVDSPGAHRPVDGNPAFPFFDHEGAVPPDTEYVTQWACSRGVKPGRTALTSYDFERPSASLAVSHGLARGHSLDDLEVFDYQGGYTARDDGQQLAEDRLDELQCRYETASGRSNAQALATGRVFELTRHPRGDQNARYLLTRVLVQAQDQASESAGETAGAPGELQCSFDAQRADQVFRPERRTPKPFVQGPQTAVVVGPEGDEIHTDRYGRVKLKFHWDRSGERHDKASCWVRVSSPWAGKNFGFVQIPRVGQEVVVDFLEGDPDQPLVTGRLYNAEQMPPWALPASATQSGLLTRSTVGGGYGHSNALRFEDKQGAEQVWLHAERDQLIEVENDEAHTVGHDRAKTVGNDETTEVKHDRTETVGNDETISIGVDRSETVGRDETIAIGANRSERVGANERITIGANRTIAVGASETASVALQRTHAVGVNETIAIGGAQEVAIGALQSVTVGAAQIVAVGASQSTTVGSKQSVSVGSDQTTTVGGAQSTAVTGDRSVAVDGAQATTIGKGRRVSVGEGDALKVGKDLVIDAGDSVTIKTGSASITMKKDGTIVIKGQDVRVDGSGKIAVKAASDVVIKGSKVGVN